MLCLEGQSAEALPSSTGQWLNLSSGLSIGCTQGAYNLNAPAALLGSPDVAALMGNVDGVASPSPTMRLDLIFYSRLTGECYLYFDYRRHLQHGPIGLHLLLDLLRRPNVQL
jgi:hypothetical protein